MSSKRVTRFVGQYSQSFDRFGDDLTELILSFLPFEDRIRLQSVAKQWNRLILNGQRVLVVDKDSDDINNVKQLLSSDGLKPKVEVNRLISLLKKCPNIRRIRFGLVSIDDSVIKEIADLCPRLESVFLIKAKEGVFHEWYFCGRSSPQKENNVGPKVFLPN